MEYFDLLITSFKELSLKEQYSLRFKNKEKHLLEQIRFLRKRPDLTQTATLSLDRVERIVKWLFSEQSRMDFDIKLSILEDNELKWLVIDPNSKEDIHLKSTPEIIKHFKDYIQSQSSLDFPSNEHQSIQKHTTDLLEAILGREEFSHHLLDIFVNLKK